MSRFIAGPSVELDHVTPETQGNVWGPRLRVLLQVAILAAVLATTVTAATGRTFDAAQALREGHAHLNGKRWAEAEKSFQRVISNIPRHTEALLALSLVWWRLDKLDAALGAVNQVLEREAHNALGLYRRGLILFAMQEYAKAEPDFRRALKLAPEQEPVWTRFYLGLSLAGQRKFAEAIPWLEAAMRENPEVIGANLHYYRNLATALMETRDYGRARVVFDSGLKRFPKDLILLHNAGRTQDALGNRDALRGYYDRAATEAYSRLTLSPRPLFHLPFRGRWKVTLGHDSLPTHVGLQTYALDFVRVDSNGSDFRGTGTSVADYWGFGADVLAPELGTVVAVEDGAPDNPPNGGARRNIGGGNSVVIQHADGVRSQMLHLKKGSIRVRPGQIVQRGEKIAEAGNSGYSLVPHLHFSFSRKLDDAWVSVPVEFRNFTLRRNGSADSVVKGAPANGDTVEPAL